MGILYPPRRAVAALPSDVRWWLCPTVDERFSFMGLRPRIWGRSPELVRVVARWGVATTAYQRAKPISLVVLVAPYFFAVIIHS